MSMKLSRNWRPGIAAKSWLVASLTLLALAALALPALRLSDITKVASRHIHDSVLGGIMTAVQLEVMLERHRRLVESAPAEVDRGQLERDQRTAVGVEQELARLMANGDASLASVVGDLLPKLKQFRAEVFLYASNFAQDKAVASAERYGGVATEAISRSSAFRLQRANQTEQWAFDLTRIADTFNIWLWVSVTAAMVILGPVGLTNIHATVSRLMRLRTAIIRLASNDVGVEIPLTEHKDEVGDIARAVTIFRSNAIALLDNQIRLRELNHQFDVALNNMPHGLCMYDSDKRVVVSNRRYHELYGLTAEDVKPGTSLKQILERRISLGLYSGSDPEEYIRDRLDHMVERSVRNEQLSDGRTIRITRSPMADGGWVTIHEDVTDQQSAALRIAHLASHDALTNLANRMLLCERLHSETTRSRSSGGFALHYLDLDRFKAVNDTLGHQVGDALLMAVAERLRLNVRASDTTARLGGDEFAILQADVDDPESARELARRLVKAISAPYQLGDKMVDIGASIGTALAPRDGVDSHELIKCADLALYHAKEIGRGSACIFEPGMRTKFLERRAIEQDLQQAIARNELELHYQPVLEANARSVAGFEALLRWRSPKRGWVSPAVFIPVAEETGLLSSIGAWVLQRACQTAATWPNDMSVAVNLSPTQFWGGDVYADVASALAASGLPARRLTLEITESTLLRDDAQVMAVLERLRGLGASIVLDDFGTGYSSMSYLRRFPFDGIKIDRSFVQNAPGKKDRVAIINAIVTMARSLDMKTVAEGVETLEDLELVQRAGCTHVQGFLFSKPVPGEMVPQTLINCCQPPRLAA